MIYETNDELTAQVWQVMQSHKGFASRIDRDRLTLAVCGRVTDNYDRKVRDALAELPVVWDDGYFIPANDAEAEPYRNSMRSRQASIGRRLRALDDYLMREREHRAVQMSLLEVG